MVTRVLLEVLSSAGSSCFARLLRAFGRLYSVTVALLEHCYVGFFLQNRNGATSCFTINSFTATGDNNRLFANSIDPDEPFHLDLCCLQKSLSTLHMNVFPNDSLLK